MPATPKNAAKAGPGKGAHQRDRQRPGPRRPGTAPQLPNLLTTTETTHAAVPDVVMTETIHDDQEQAGLLPGEHALDPSYAGADVLMKVRDAASP